MHKHLVSLIGVVTRGSPKMVVISFCEHGELLSVLKKKVRLLPQLAGMPAPAPASLAPAPCPGARAVASAPASLPLARSCSCGKIFCCCSSHGLVLGLWPRNMCNIAGRLQAADGTPFEDKNRLCYEIADGMAHLASLKLVHRDLAARNVLLGSGWVCKGAARNVNVPICFPVELADGLSRLGPGGCAGVFLAGSAPFAPLAQRVTAPAHCFCRGACVVVSRDALHSCCSSSW